jgi:hypothetical protein
MSNTRVATYAACFAIALQGGASADYDRALADFDRAIARRPDTDVLASALAFRGRRRRRRNAEVHA